MGSVGGRGFLQPPCLPPLPPGMYPLVIEVDSGFGFPGPLKSERST